MKKSVLYIYSLCILLFSCSEKELEPINSSSGKPAQVTDISIKSIPGGAEISFVLPKDNNVLSVKASYTLTNGTQRESITSFYGNSLKIEGYNDVEEHEVLLYTISRAQEVSDPIPVKITPLESPLKMTSNSTTISSDFGGANFFWRNEEKVLLTAELFAQTDEGDLKTVKIVTSQLDSASFSIRGYDVAPRKFAIVFRDNWDNVSDTIYPKDGTVTPWLESKLDKKLWSVYKVNGNYIGGDASFDNWEGRNEYIYDDDLNTIGHSYTGSLPVALTIDLGGEMRLSRVLFFQRLHQNIYYSWGNPRRIVVFGKKEAPSASGQWDEWTELINYEIVKPSGTNSDFTTNTDEDIVAAQNGHEASFPISSETYRYLRFRFLTSWEDRPYVHPAEITVYGDYAE